MARFAFNMDNEIQDQKFNLTLSGTQYGLRLKLNRRSDRWSFDLFDVDGNVMIHGRKFVSDYDLLKQLASLIKPTGMLFALSNSKTGDDATSGTLGESVVLLYDDLVA